MHCQLYLKEVTEYAAWYWVTCLSWELCTCNWCHPAKHYTFTSISGITKNREAYLGILVARYTREVTSRISAAKAVFNMWRTSSEKLHLNLRKELVKCYIWSIALYNAERLKLRKINHKYPESFEICCWRMIMKISGNDRVKKSIRPT